MKKAVVVLLLLMLTISALPLKAEDNIVNVGYYKAPSMSSKYNFNKRIPISCFKAK